MRIPIVFPRVILKAVFYEERTERFICSVFEM
jgi:hypothetical protein